MMTHQEAFSLSCNMYGFNRNTIFLTNCLGLGKPDRLCHVRGEDINPATGKGYAINPSSGAWDDNYFAQNFGGGSGGSSGGGQGPSIPGFTFDWDQAENDALKELTPYYQKKLAEANGDVELAKKRIEEDYQQGLRYNKEDAATQTTADTQTAKEETDATMDSLNQRGILFGQIQDPEQSQEPISGIAKTLSLDPLATKQDARRQAIQRAIQRSDSSLAMAKQRGTDDANLVMPRLTRELNQEKQDKAILQMAPLKEQQAYRKYQATVGRSLNPYLQSA